MGCCSRRVKQFIWTSDPDADGKTHSIVCSTEVEARARVLRRGGSYQEKR